MMGSASRTTAHRPKLDDTFRPGYGMLVPALGIALLLALVWLHATHEELYIRLLAYWMDQPLRDPFRDLEDVLYSITCWRQGIDVYLHTSCNVTGGAFNYSPLWLRLSFVPTDPTWTPWLGLGLVSVFLLSLGLLPQPRHWGDRALVVLGTFSCLPVFAIERGNLDLLMFLLALVAALCLARGFALRLIGYIVIMIAGLLKFYPWAALVLLLRERLRIAAVLGFIALVGIAAFAWWYHDELGRIAIPHGGQAGDNWGAIDLPLGIRAGLVPMLAAMGVDESASATIRDIAANVAWLLLVTASVGCAGVIAARRDVHAALAALPPRVHVFLLIGAALVCGCFFAGPNVGYRGVFLLFVLPCLLGLARISMGTGAARLFRLTAYATLYVLWMLLIQRAVAKVFGGSFYPVRGSAVGYAAWLLRELLWWWVATVLLAILIRFGLDSPAWRDLLRLTRAAARQATSPASRPGPG